MGEVAKLIREDFLQQNAFTDYDYTCPLTKSVGMLKCIICFYDQCQKAIADSPADDKVTWAMIKTSQASIIQKVVDTKFVEPKEDPAKIPRATMRSWPRSRRPSRRCSTRRAR